MILSKPVRELLQIASEHHFVVELHSERAIIRNFPGGNLTIIDHLCGSLHFYKNEDLISKGQFKNLLLSNWGKSK